MPDKPGIRVHGGRSVELALLAWLIQNRPEFRRAFNEARERQLAAASIEQIITGLRSQSVSPALIDNWTDVFGDLISDPWEPRVIATFGKIGRSLAKAVRKFTGEPFSYNPDAPWIGEYLATESRELITALVDGTANGLRSVYQIHRDEDRIPVETLAGLIRQAGIGPGPRSARKIANIQQQLIEQETPVARIGLITARETNKALVTRADVTSRSEIAGAWGFAAPRVYREAIQQGIFPPGLIPARRWLTAQDARVCPICEPLDDTVVLADQGFPGGEPGSIHLACRCTEEEVLLTAAEAETELAA